MTQTDDARGPDEWKCAGCGIAGPDTDRRCDCATSVVCCGNRGEWKTGPTWATQPDPLADPRVAALATARRDALEEAAKVCQRISNTDLAATNPPYEAGYSDAADACFHAIRALIAQEEPTT